MKKISILLLASYCLLPLAGQSQTFNEWFRQKKTQIKYLHLQIAELQVYLGHVKKGYQLVSSGLSTINDIKKGEFKLHDLYYTSLGLVNPRIRNSPHAMGIIGHLQYILKITVALKELLPLDSSLTASQKKYIKECLGRLLEDLEKTRSDLIDITTDKTFELTDNERLERLSTLYEKSKSQFVFIQQFSGEAFALIESHRRQKAEQRTLEAFHDLR